MRFSSRPELIASIEHEHQTFLDLANSVPKTRYKERGVWGDGWTLHDLFAHLTEWEQMFLRWFRDGVDGRTPVLPAPGYKWSETPRLNRAIWRKHHRRSTSAVLAESAASYSEILGVARGLSEKELFARAHFAWTGKNHLATYLGANTTSHYRTATNIVRRWLRGRKKPNRLGAPRS